MSTKEKKRRKKDFYDIFVFMPHGHAGLENFILCI